MAERRIAGIDLGIASAHTVVVLTGDGTEVCRRRCVPTAESLGWIEQQALEGAPEGTVLEVVLEPTGPAWLAPTVFFGSRGHAVYRVSSQKASDLRKFLSRHTKSNSIDALTLARLAIVDPGSLQPVELPGADRATLDRRVRACDRLTREAATRKSRIKTLVRQLLPMTPLTGDLGQADLAVLERWADPNALLKAGKSRLTAVIAKASHNHLGEERGDEWLAAARDSVEVYGGDSAVAFTDLAAEVATEVRLLRATQAELGTHAEVREAAYGRVDPEALARSVPGLAEVGGPVVVSVMRRPHRFARGEQFKSFTGLVPRTSETGESDRKGQPMSKAGSSMLRSQLLRSADTARTLDPQLAAIYYTQMVERGATHTKARGAPGRAGVGRDGEGDAVRPARHRRPSSHQGRGQDRDRRALDGAGGGPAAPTEQEGGEGPSPSPRGTCSGQRSKRDNEAAFPTRILGPRGDLVNDAGRRCLTPDLP
jgi:transposase